MCALLTGVPESQAECHMLFCASCYVTWWPPGWAPCSWTPHRAPGTFPSPLGRWKEEGSSPRCLPLSPPQSAAQGKAHHETSLNESAHIHCKMNSLQNCSILDKDKGPRYSYLLKCFATSGCSSRLQASHSSKQGESLVLGKTDVSIVVQTEDLGSIVDGQTTDVWQVTLRDRIFTGRGQRTAGQ